MEKKIKAWLIFLVIFTLLLALFSVSMVYNNIRLSKKLVRTLDTLKAYKQLYYELKDDYQILEHKYNIAMRSALAGNREIVAKQRQLLKLQKVLQSKIQYYKV